MRALAARTRPNTRALGAACVVACLLACLTALGGCTSTRQAGATTDALRLDRVVLYQNGVGYFERAGKVEGDRLRLKVRKDQINDLLKSLAVVDRSSGKGVGR